MNGYRKHWQGVAFAGAGIILACGFLSGCSKAGAGGGPPPAWAVKVIAVEARAQTVTEKISLVGTTTPNEFVEIKSELDGKIEVINFDEGRPVEKGRLLIQQGQSKVAASVAQAEANFKLAEANLKRSESLLADKTVSRQEFDQATAAFEASRATLELMRQQFKDTVIHAPFDGVMGARLVSQGQFLTKGTLLTSLVSLDPIKAEFKVPERFLSEVRVGQSVSIRVAAYPGETFQGEVYFIDPRVDELTRSALLKAKIPNPDQKLKPGMFGNLDLALKVRENAIVIPESALTISSEKTSLFVVDKDSLAQPRTVEVGVRMAGLAEITKGLEAGEKVVTEGFQKLQPGAKVILANVENKSEK